MVTEKVILVKNDKLEEVNRLASQGWSVKMITPPCSSNSGRDLKTDVYTYVVLRREYK